MPAYPYTIRHDMRYFTLPARFLQPHPPSPGKNPAHAWGPAIGPFPVVGGAPLRHQHVASYGPATTVIIVLPCRPKRLVGSAFPWLSSLQPNNWVVVPVKVTPGCDPENLPTN